MKVPLDRLLLSSKFLKTVERDRANFGILERHRFAIVQTGPYPVGAQNLAGHVVAGNLLLSVVRKQDGLERAQSNGVKPGKPAAAPIQCFAFANSHGLRDDLL